MGHPRWPTFFATQTIFNAKARFQQPNVYDGRGIIVTRERRVAQLQRQIEHTFIAFVIATVIFVVIGILIVARWPLYMPIASGRSSQMSR